ncbi:MAG: hypothetical protein V3V08_20590 [Nannocystaceae bacterium]
MRVRSHHVEAWHGVPASTTPTARRVAFLGALLTVAGLFVVHAEAWRFLCDDAYIAFRYAHNLAWYGAPTFNPGEGPAVEGYTSPLWITLLAAGARAGVVPESFAPLMTRLASAVGLAASVLLVRTLRLRSASTWHPSDLLPAVFLVAVPEYMVWTHGGLETSCAATLVVCCALAWARGHVVFAAGIAALVALTRLDGLVPIAGLGVAWLGLRSVAYRRGTALGFGPVALSRRKVLAAALVFLAPLAVHFLWRHAYYGSWWPNTWHIKRHGVALRDTYGAAYVLSWGRHLALPLFVPLAACGRPRHVVLVFPVLLTVAYAWSIGGDFMGYSRLLLPATALSGCALSWLALDAATWVCTRWSRAAPMVLLSTTVAVAGGAWWSASQRQARDREGGWLERRFESVQAMHEFSVIRVEAGRRMKALLPAETRLIVGAAGALPYASGLYAIDAYGLVDPTLAEVAEPDVGQGARPGHQIRATRAHLAQYRPDLLCHIGWHGARRPSKTSARQRSGSRAYVWACVEHPMLDDTRTGGQIPAGYYCCLRRRGAVVGSFGAERS